MGGTPPQRAVEVLNERTGSYGSGTVVGPGLVLTAYHVACLGGDENGVTVRMLAGGAEDEGVVVWADARLDAVLVECDPELIGPTLSPVRWGRLVCEESRTRPVCTVTGFPRAMLLSDPAYEGVQDPKSVDGWIKPSGELRSGLYTLEVRDADPDDAGEWAGISGAAVFCGAMVVGIALIAPGRWSCTAGTHSEI